MLQEIILYSPIITCNTNTRRERFWLTLNAVTPLWVAIQNPTARYRKPSFNLLVKEIQETPTTKYNIAIG